MSIMTAENTPDKQARSHRIKRLIYRASYTGMKETDLLLGQFAKRYLPNSSDAELDEFQALLDAGDPNIFAWVRGDSQPPANLDGVVLAQIRKFQSEL